MGARDKDGFGTGGLIAATASGWRDANELGRWGSAIGRCRGELVLNDRLDVIDAYEDILRF